MDTALASMRGRARRSPLLRWGFALVLAAAAIAIRVALGPSFRLTFLMFFPAIAAAAWFGGLGPGLLVTALSTATALYYFAPEGTFAIAHAGDALALIVFASIGTMITTLYERVAQARRRAEATAVELAQALRTRDEFISIAGHELRTPLQAIKLTIESAHRLVARGLAPEMAPRIVERIARTEAQVERLERLVSELLDVSRIVAGRLPLSLDVGVDLAELARAVIERLADAAAAAGCELAVSLDEGVVGVWDRSRLDQVLSNLLGNAIKYGAGKPIAVRVERAAVGARLSVADHGIGIAAEAQARIFERFERAVSERNFGGLGLGLWIARNIVESHGGTIAVDSRPGEGARFTVELPASSSTAGRAPTAPPVLR